jgi:prepilin-type N-terminal cleavage/methylation domain-containing protein
MKKKNSSGFNPLETIARLRKPKMSLTGFSLIELLIVTMILSVVSLAVFSTFSSGLEIWHRINRKTTNEELVIFCHRLRIDLSNSFKFTGIDFIGREDKLEFASLVNFPALTTKSVGQVIYELDEYNHALVRIKKDYSAIYTGQEARPEQVLQSIKNIQFQYYFFDPKTKEYAWQDEWLKKELPLAVKLEVEFDDEEIRHKFVQTFGVPVAVKERIFE